MQRHSLYSSLTSPEISGDSIPSTAAEGLDPADIDAWVKVEEGMRRLIQKK